MKKTVKIFVILFLTIAIFAVGDDGYKMPPKAIRDLVDAPLTPVVYISSDKKHILILERASLPSIEELSQTELRLAGLRINPRTNGRSRSSYYTGIVVQEIKSGRQKMIKGLPKDGRISNVSWSPDGKHIAMTVIRLSLIHI